MFVVLREREKKREERTGVVVTMCVEYWDYGERPVFVETVETLGFQLKYCSAKPFGYHIYIYLLYKNLFQPMRGRHASMLRKGK